jgi:hypothetical protein
MRCARSRRRARLRRYYEPSAKPHTIKRQGKPFFLERKNQRTFVLSCAVHRRRLGRKTGKSLFRLFFFRKRSFFLILARMAWHALALGYIRQSCSASPARPVLPGRWASAGPGASPSRGSQRPGSGAREFSRPQCRDSHLSGTSPRSAPCTPDLHLENCRNLAHHAPLNDRGGNNGRRPAASEAGTRHLQASDR